MPTLNLGIVAHVDAGKTTLTERLLFETGVSDHVGSVSRGDTKTDTDALERERGITIRSAVVSFTIGDTLVNLIDTPGHSDFVAEVERALGILDGAVLVVSAVEGVQAQTRILIRSLERLQIPFLIFVNKIDRIGARYDETIADLRRALAGDAIALGDLHGAGTRAVMVGNRDDTNFQDELVELLAEYDDTVLSRYVDDPRPLTAVEAHRKLAQLTRRVELHPVYFGSAITGAGVAELIDGLTRYLPPSTDHAGTTMHASVFKIEHLPAGQKIAYARMYAGVLSTRDHLTYYRRSSGGTPTELHGRITSISTFTHGTETSNTPAMAGDIAKLTGLSDVEIGDQLGRWDPPRGGRHFASPGLEAVVRARKPSDRLALYDALRQLAEQDPLINTRLDGIDQELTVSLYGEVQKEVLAARLAGEFGIIAEFSPTQTVYVERVSGAGQALEEMGGVNPFMATVGLRVEPGPVDSGVTFARAVKLGGLLLSYHTAIEETVHATLREGLYGWRVTDCLVTLTHTAYSSVHSTAGDFRGLTRVVLRAALARAGTTVCMPISEFELEIPASALSQVLHRLTGARAVLAQSLFDGATCRLTGVVPTHAVHEFEQRLPGLTKGEGFIVTRPAGHRAIQGSVPRRDRRSALSRTPDRWVSEI
jgi:ribosomal protection tetracycline resistance protein